MSDMEAKLYATVRFTGLLMANKCLSRRQKLKVAELKEILAKHHLVQTGKKDDLVKRLLENNISVDDEGQEVVDGEEEELEDPEAETNGHAPASAQAPAPATTTGNATSSTQPQASTSTSSDSLTPEQQAMKARAERFGIAFNPNPTPRSGPTAKSAVASSSAPSAAVSTLQEKKEKPAAIDKSAGLGISEEVLAKRAAKFGLPEKKEPVTAAPSEGAPKKAEAEMTPSAQLSPKARAFADHRLQRDEREHRERRREEAKEGREIWDRPCRQRVIRDRSSKSSGHSASRESSS